MGNICSSSPVPKPAKIKNQLLIQYSDRISIEPSAWTFSLKVKKEGNIEILPSIENLSDEIALLKQQYNDEKSIYDEYYNKSAKLSMRLLEIKEEKRKIKDNVDEIKSKIEQTRKKLRKNSTENKENEVERLMSDFERDNNQKKILQEELSTVCDIFWPLAIEYENLSKTLRNVDESILLFYTITLESLKTHLEELENVNGELKKELLNQSLID